MSDATIPAAPTSQPDPNRAGTGAAMPRIASLLTLVRCLIEYGRNLVTTLQQSPSGPTFIDIAAGFGTIDIAAILARIACGLRRAAALEARLHRRAATGRDFLPDPPAAPAPAAPPSAAPPKPRNPRPKPPPRQLPDGLPTAEQIAAAVRHRPVGAVIEDICHEFGILFGDLDPILYRQIFRGITYYGGNFARFLRGMFTRLRTRSELQQDSTEPPDPQQANQPKDGPASANPTKLPTGPP
jgi:hypothetical protein